VGGGFIQEGILLKKSILILELIIGISTLSVIFIPETLSVVSIARQPSYPTRVIGDAQLTKDFPTKTPTGQPRISSPAIMTPSEIVSISAAVVASGAVIVTRADDNAPYTADK